MDNNTIVNEEEKKNEFVIPMNNTNEELTDDEKKFLDELDEKYKDRNDYKDTPIVSKVSDVMIDESGRTIINEEPGSLSSVKVDDNGADTVKRIMEQGTKEITELPSEEKINKELQDMYDLDEKDTFIVFNIMQRMQKGEKFSVYNAMPDKIKGLVGAAMAANNIPVTMENRNIVARALIDDMLNDIKTDDEFIELNDALKELAEIPSVIDFHAENYKEVMEVKIPEAAEKCKEEKPEVYKSLMAIVDAWHDTYTFRRQNELLDSSESARNSVTKRIDEVYKNFTRDFNFKAEKSKYIINDINLVFRALKAYFGDKYKDEIYKSFVCLFIRVSINLDFNKPEEISFIYYSIKNIISLEFVNKDKVLDFNKELTSNIETFLDRIKELDQAYQEKIKNNPNKRNMRREARRNRKKGGK